MKRMLTMVIIALFVLSYLPITVSGATWIDDVTVTTSDSNGDAKPDTAHISVIVDNDNSWFPADYITVEVKLFPPGKDATPSSSDFIDSDAYTDNNPPTGAPIAFEFNLTTTSTSGMGSYTILIEEENDDNDGSNYETTTRSVDLFQLDLSASFLLSVDQGEKIVNLGQQVTYSFTIENKGSLPDTYNVGIQTAPVGWQASSDKTSLTINENSTDTFTVTLTAPSTYSGGDKYISLEISAQSQASSASQKLFIKSTIGLADLKVSQDDLSLSIIDPEVSQEIDLEARIYNDGTITASNVKVLFLIEEEEVGTDTISSLPSGGASEVAEVKWTATQGSLKLTVKVDPDSSIDEFKDDNNQANLPFVVRASDLTISSSDISVSPDKLQDGGTVTFSIKVHNTGTANATNVKVKLSVDTYEKEGEVDNIGKNGGTATINITWEAKAGSHKVKVDIDLSNTVPEVNENNNNAEITVDVNSPPIANITTEKEKVFMNKAVTFNAGDSTDPDGTLKEYYFDFGDGTKSDWGTSSTVSHTYTTTGTYTVTMKVRDNDDAESVNTAKLTITVKKKAEVDNPGFEVIGMLVAISVVAIFLTRKKRF